MWYIIGFLVIWTIASVAWFLQVMGDKYRKGKWYDNILCPPALVICMIIGFIGGVISLLEKK